jgi:ferredoxin-thioredoxin reductase catalytic chain
MGAYEENGIRLEAIAKEKGLALNPDGERVKKVVGLMTENFITAGEYICTCKQTQRPPIKGKDTTCPCPELEDEIKDNGHCHCRLFFTIEGDTHGD